ncbi:hypothetical protein R3P38DRAFT_2803595 [Favolaschia claudopus]|uniref:Uncharacterized protein n=1 Tax=Favolaschia claudopus TaxID=2862362 RepID=A0AAV9ZSZ3_9AGAR
MNDPGLSLPYAEYSSPPPASSIPPRHNDSAPHQTTPRCAGLHASPDCGICQLRRMINEHESVHGFSTHVLELYLVALLPANRPLRHRAQRVALLFLLHPSACAALRLRLYSLCVVALTGVVPPFPREPRRERLPRTRVGVSATLIGSGSWWGTWRWNRGLICGHHDNSSSPPAYLDGLFETRQLLSARIHFDGGGTLLSELTYRSSSRLSTYSITPRPPPSVYSSPPPLLRSINHIYTSTYCAEAISSPSRRAYEFMLATEKTAKVHSTPSPSRPHPRTSTSTSGVCATSSARRHTPRSACGSVMRRGDAVPSVLASVDVDAASSLSPSSIFISASASVDNPVHLAHTYAQTPRPLPAALRGGARWRIEVAIRGGVACAIAFPSMCRGILVEMRGGGDGAGDGFVGALSNGGAGEGEVNGGAHCKVDGVARRHPAPAQPLSRRLRRRGLAGIIERTRGERAANEGREGGMRVLYGEGYGSRAAASCGAEVARRGWGGEVRMGSAAVRWCGGGGIDGAAAGPRRGAERWGVECSGGYSELEARKGWWKGETTEPVDMEDESVLARGRSSRSPYTYLATWLVERRRGGELQTGSAEEHDPGLTCSWAAKELCEIVVERRFDTTSG